MDEIPKEDEDYTLHTAKKNAFIRALDKAKGNNNDAIQRLGISRTAYYDSKKKFGL
jgi:transcriptional regulator of acetoin/glycerol metabolism